MEAEKLRGKMETEKLRGKMGVKIWLTKQNDVLILYITFRQKH